MRVGFHITGPGGGRWSVDFREGQRGVLSHDLDCQYRYTFESRWLPDIIAGKLLWEDFLLSVRMKTWRDPDVYNDHLLGVLKFANAEAYQAVEEFETLTHRDDPIRITSDGVDYTIERWCPHAGADLSLTGEALPDGRLRCVAHCYEFDLCSGECVNASCRPLKVWAEGAPDRPRGDVSIS